MFVVLFFLPTDSKDGELAALNVVGKVFYCEEDDKELIVEVLFPLSVSELETVVAER